MISVDDARYAKELDDCYVIQPAFQWWSRDNHSTGRSVSDDFSYSSDTNDRWLTIPQLQEMIKE
jgi:UDP-N-acetylglucosamine 4,6-dehydratase